MAAEREKPMPEAEVNAWLQKNLPKWRLEDGWIRRTYKTSGWKGTLMDGRSRFAASVSDGGITERRFPRGRITERRIRGGRIVQRRRPWREHRP